MQVWTPAQMIIHTQWMFTAFKLCYALPHNNHYTFLLENNSLYCYICIPSIWKKTSTIDLNWLCEIVEHKKFRGTEYSCCMLDFNNVYDQCINLAVLNQSLSKRLSNLVERITVNLVSKSIHYISTHKWISSPLIN